MIFQGYWLNNSAVDPKRGKIETIIEERESAFEKDSLQNGKLDRHESYISRMRNKHNAKKQSNVFKVGKYQPKKEE